MPMDNVTLENTQQSISSRDAKSVASVLVNGKWVNLSDTLEQANIKSDVGTVSKQVAEQQKVVTSAVVQADSAVAYANDAIEKSRVNSQAIVEINSAVSDAVSGAAVASAAISSARTEAIAAADEAKASASAAQADIVAVRSDVAAVQADVTANKSDVAVAKSDIAVAKTDLASQATSLSSYAAQASAAGEDITTLKSQAGHFEQEMADTKGDVSQLKISASSASAALSDADGNISSLQVSAKSYSAALSDAKGDIATVKATASELETKYADAAGDINKLQTDAKGTTQALADAQGDIAKLKTRADGFDTEFASTNGDISKLQTDASGTKQTLTNAKGDIAVLQSRADGFDTKFADTAGDINKLQVDASGMKQTLTDAKGDISTLQATATGFKNMLTDAQGNISTLQSDVAGLKRTTSDHAGDIATLQADAKTLTSQMSSAQGDISTLNQTASGISSKVSGMDNEIKSKVSSTDVNNLLDSKGYATTDSVQSLISQNAGSINETITQLDTKFKTGMENSVQLVRKSDFEDGDKGNWTVQAVVSATNPAPPAELGQSGMKVLQTNTRDGYEDGIWYSVKPGEKFDVDFWCMPSTKFHTTFGLVFYDRNQQNPNWQGIGSDQSGQWEHYVGTITAPANASFAMPWYQMEKPFDNTTDSAWIAKPSIRRQNASTISAIQSVQASVDGIKSTVATKADQSTVTQLSNLVQAKVSSGDFTSTTTQLKNEINQRVQVGDVISQINQEAGGDTLIQVSNGTKSLILDAGNTIITGKAWIPSAAIADLTADQVQAGTLSGSKVHAGDNSGNAIDMGALSTNYVGFHAYANNGDNTYIDLDGIHNYGASYDTRIQQGKITTNYLAVNGGGMIDFRDSTGTGMVADGSTLTFDVSNTSAGYLSYNGMPVAEIPDGSGGNELAIRYGLSTAIIPEDSSGAQATFSKAAQKIAYMTGTDRGKQMLSGLEVHSNNHHWLCAVNSDATCNRFEVNDRNGLNIAWHDNTHFFISDGNAKLYKDTDDSPTATKLEVHGWAWINGWVEAAGHSQHSALSTKTDIQSVDDDKMLKMVNDTDLTTFLYKTDVANGETHRHIGPIIDDVHDVAQYQTPQDFIAPNGVSRDDDNMIGALFGAVKALTKRIKTLESKVG